MSGRPIVCFVTAGGHHPAIIANALGDTFGPIHVVMEVSESRRAFLSRRAQLVGALSILGQFATMGLVVAMKRLQARRIAAMARELNVQLDLSPEHTVHQIGSANSEQLVEVVGQIVPDVILLCGCRLIKASVLAQFTVPVLNYRAGITPMYRGMNGGYWALAQGDAGNFGTTVHLVDAGVDTGAIVGQMHLKPSTRDTLWTHAYRQAAASRELCAESVQRAVEGTLQALESAGPSTQWFHPPIWSYVWTGLRKGVW